jgi:hypothetical protein
MHPVCACIRWLCLLGVVVFRTVQTSGILVHWLTGLLNSATVPYTYEAIHPAMPQVIGPCVLRMSPTRRLTFEFFVLDFSSRSAMLNLFECLMPIRELAFVVGYLIMSHQSSSSPAVTCSGICVSLPFTLTPSETFIPYPPGQFFFLLHRLSLLSAFQTASSNTTSTPS